MFTQFISAVCTLGVIVVAILLTTRMISLEDALKYIGKILLVILLIYLAVCILASSIRAGVMALYELLRALVGWLVVAVCVIATLTLVLWALISRRRARSNSNSAQE